jgi:hypothetical protein
VENPTLHLPFYFNTLVNTNSYTEVNYGLEQFIGKADLVPIIPWYNASMADTDFAVVIFPFLKTSSPVRIGGYNLSVGGNLYLRHTAIKTIPQGVWVGRQIYG